MIRSQKKFSPQPRKLSWLSCPVRGFGFSFRVFALNLSAMGRARIAARTDLGTRAVKYPPHAVRAEPMREAVDAVSRALKELPTADNEKGAVDRLLRANAILRNVLWPSPFDQRPTALNSAMRAICHQSKATAFT